MTYSSVITFTCIHIHIHREFATENLCFATEYSQFRESLNLNEKQKSLMGCNVIFHTAISTKKSQFQADGITLDCQKFISIITKLYNKYIKFDTATYEINVSYNARLSLAVLIDPKYKQYVMENREQYADLQDIAIPTLPRNNLHQTIQIIIPILEVILFEVTCLLQNAFTRFRRTTMWTELCQELIAEQNRRSSILNSKNEESRTHTMNFSSRQSRNSRLTLQLDRPSSISAFIMGGRRGSTSNLLRVAATKMTLNFKSKSAPTPDDDHGHNEVELSGAVTPNTTTDFGRLELNAISSCSPDVPDLPETPASKHMITLKYKGDEDPEDEEVEMVIEDRIVVVDNGDDGDKDMDNEDDKDIDTEPQTELNTKNTSSSFRRLGTDSNAV